MGGAVRPLIPCSGFGYFAAARSWKELHPEDAVVGAEEDLEGSRTCQVWETAGSGSSSPRKSACLRVTVNVSWRRRNRSRTFCPSGRTARRQTPVLRPAIPLLAPPSIDEEHRLGSFAQRLRPTPLDRQPHHVQCQIVLRPGNSAGT